MYSNIEHINEIKKRDKMRGLAEHFNAFCSELNKSKYEGKDQESIQSSATPDPGHHMG